MTSLLPNPEYAQLLIEQFGHEAHFEFDLPDQPYEEVKLTLELAGYSVHRTRENPERVVAFRAEPDRAPVYWA